MEVACVIDFVGQEALLKEMDCVYGGSIFAMNRVFGIPNCGYTLINYERRYKRSCYFKVNRQVLT